jgi:hypothetical protein
MELRSESFGRCAGYSRDCLSGPLTNSAIGGISAPKAYSGQAAPVSIHAWISSPKSSCVPGGGISAFARVPAPSNKVIACGVLVQQRQVATAVALLVFELTANVPQRFPLPGHLDGREVPARVPGNASIRGLLVEREVVARVAGLAGSDAPRHGRLVNMPVIALTGMISVGVAVHAPRTRKDFRGLGKKSPGPCRRLVY